MVADSVIKAVENLIAGLNPVNFPGGVLPPVFFDEAPQEGATGAQQRPPYVIISDKGSTSQWDMETNAIDIPSSFSLEVYAVSLGDCDLIMKAIMWNGANPNQRLGLAFATLDLNPPLYAMPGGVIPTTDQHNYAGLNYQAKRVHKYVQNFQVQSYLRGTG